MKKTTKHLILVLAATLTLSAGQAIAQAQLQQPQDAQQGVSQEFDRPILEKYAALSVEIGKIRNEVAQKLETTKDQKQAMEIQQEATRKTISMIEDQGLDIATYNKIAHQINVDPELRKEIEQIGKLD
jgi:hypothetical protein